MNILIYQLFSDFFRLSFRKVIVFKKSPPSYKWGFQLCSTQKETYFLKKKKSYKEKLVEQKSQIFKLS